MQQPEKSTTYEEDRISNAIRRVQLIQERAKAGSAPAEFYQTIWETLVVLDEAIVESKNTQRAYDKMCRRVEIMEGMLALLLRVRPKLIKTEDAPPEPLSPQAVSQKTELPPEGKSEKPPSG